MFSIEKWSGMIATLGVVLVLVFNLGVFFSDSKWLMYTCLGVSLVGSICFFGSSKRERLLCSKRSALKFTTGYVEGNIIRKYDEGPVTLNVFLWDIREISSTVFVFLNPVVFGVYYACKSKLQVHAASFIVAGFYYIVMRQINSAVDDHRIACKDLSRINSRDIQFIQEREERRMTESEIRESPTRKQYAT